jgi:hypothetical protein
MTAENSTTCFNIYITYVNTHDTPNGGRAILRNGEVDLR